jgi:arylsulfatase A-like enzyme
MPPPGAIRRPRKGKTANGDWADNVGQMPEAVEKAGVRENTIVIFTSDNGLEFIRPWNGPGWCSVGGAW